MKLDYPFPIGLPTSWAAPSQVNLPSGQLTNWLLDSGSLTARLKALCNEFQLVLLGQRPAAPTLEEFQQVRGDTQQLSADDWQVREVLLCGDDKPWVFARSIIPQTLCNSDFVNLNSQPLGQLIFNDKRFKRMPIEVSKMADTANFLPHLGLPCSESLWGRRSVFSFEEQKMMVSEMFLPGSPAYWNKD